MSILYTKNLRKEFGGVIAISDLDINIEKNKITGVIGPNGAGKTTLFNIISGFDDPTEGFIFFKGQDITRKKPHKITRLGIARTFQNIRLFKDMSVLDNVKIGRHFKGTHLPGPINKLFLMSGIKNEEKDIQQKSEYWLDYFNLSDFKGYKAKDLPYGKQKELEIARAMATEPYILFLDEPAAGLNHTETEHLMSIIIKLQKLDVTIVIIEHDMKLIMGICNNIVVLNYGQKIAEGTPREIQKNIQVIEAYLGKEND
ncbi:MAG: ABC transporter ATP-binding protein [Candidatus Margulisbacteria bacterium]|nr:ABC transporter ATP-binding protein [Candidatus Margulisiibacteriota bacterium]